MTAPPQARNRLARETSPYLQQHACNPVDWYPWGPEALARARVEQKPILLSIGYSACHWCHVMAHESFEDEHTAAVMNELFVNIKVDREERPDLDRIYQTAHQLLVRRAGGWPLTMFLTPDQVPFFGGTYFPREARHGLPSFTDILRRVSDFLRQHAQDIEKQNSSLLEALNNNLEAAAPGATDPNAAVFATVRQQLGQSFDKVHGGFGAAPKFPHPANLDHLLRHWNRSSVRRKQDQDALSMAAFTLLRMCEGGLYDHLGGGFCRYSVDEQWMIPHFEKMLYDNGPLLALCAEAHRCTGDFRFQRAAEETGNWVLREMQSPEGGFYSTLDADSEGHEGKFYVWDRGQVQDLLPSREFLAFGMRFGLERAPNFEERWHLHGYVDEPALAKRLKIPIAELVTMLDRSRDRLFDEREKRIRPARDEKILTSWNGLMIRGLAVAGRHLNRPDFVDAASRGLDFILEHLWRQGRLLAVYKGGKARLPAYLDDYAFLLEATLELFQTRWRSSDLKFAMALADALVEHFEDREKGGFFFTADDHERLIHRPKPLYDDALPSGNGVAAWSLLRLGHLLGNTRYLDAANNTVHWAWASVERAPAHHIGLLRAVEEWLDAGDIIVIRGAGEELSRWHRRAVEPYAPYRLCVAIPKEENALPGTLAQQSAQGETVAYICSGSRCSAPITDFADFHAALSATEPGTATSTG